MMHDQIFSPAQKEILEILMKVPQLDSFRLVGGTSLSLQLGHRKSVDIDLFTYENYSSIQFQAIDESLKSIFDNITGIDGIVAGMGKSYDIMLHDESVKVDVFYAKEKFIQPVLMKDGIRLATIEEIIAMKLDVVTGGGRKKDFWDLHELIPRYSFEKMLAFHAARSPDTHDPELIRKNFTSFYHADHDFDPICLRGKYWELIKVDLVDFVAEAK